MCTKPIFRKIVSETSIHNGKEFFFDCGKCDECRKKRTSQWAFRIMKECAFKYAYMFTLTYKNPPIKDNEESLSKRDLQLFFKKLRATAGRARPAGARKMWLKYYAAGEYGEKLGRPHYHIIMISDVKDIVELVECTWQHGHVHHMPASEASIFYALKYLRKGANEVRDLRRYGKEKEFQLMSKGIGKIYLTEKTINYHKKTLNLYINLSDGYKLSLPRYFKKEIFTDDELQIATLKAQVYLEQKNNKLKCIQSTETEKKQREKLILVK